MEPGLHTGNFSIDHSRSVFLLLCVCFIYSVFVGLFPCHSMRLVQGMYANVRSCVHVSEWYSEEFEVKVGVHQGSVHSPLLFIIVLEALSCKFCSGVPWEDLYVDDLVILTELLEECVRRLLTWRRKD